VGQWAAYICVQSTVNAGRRGMGTVFWRRRFGLDVVKKVGADLMTETGIL